jgi:hypothetical protein
MRPQSAEPIKASGHAMTASTGRTHDRKQPDHARRPLFSCKPGAIHTWLFSSTDSTTAWAGGSTYRPTMSSSLAANAGSLDSLKRLTRCGCKPCAAQIRWTERSEMPAASAIARPVQWVASPGGDHPLDLRPGQRRLARRPALVLQQSGDPRRHEAFLPPPYRRLGAAHLAPDRKRAHAIGAQQHNARPLDMLLAAVPIRHDRLEPSAITGGNSELDPLAHPGTVASLAANGTPMIASMH